MKIKVETLEEILGEVETEERSEIILPFLEKISELEEKNEELKEKLRNIFKEITKAITIDGLYEKIKEIGDLIDSDLSEQIEFIKTINEAFRDSQREIMTLQYDKKSIEIKCAQIQKENEELREKISKLEDTNRKLSGELLNQNEEIHMLEEEIDRLKSENEDLKRLNRQIQEVQK